MLKDYFWVAIHSLFRRRLRSLLTMLGIFIGIAAVVSLISLGQGLQDAVVGQFQGLGADRLQITAASAGFGPPGSFVAQPLTKDDEEVVENTRGVKLALGRLVEPVLAEYDGSTSVRYIASWPEDPDEVRLLFDTTNYVIKDGRDLKPSDKYKLTMGYDFGYKKTLGENVVVGDTITLQGVDFEIVGIYDSTGFPQFDFSILVNEEVVRDLLELPDKYGFILGQVDSVDNIDETADSVRRNLRKHRGVDEGKEDFDVETTQGLIESISEILDIVTAVLAGIAAISLGVGGIGIMNTMYTSILERRKEIGIMKSIGARNSDIANIFIIESGLLGLVGGVIGVLLGMGLSKMVEFGARQALGSDLITASFPLYLIIGSLAFSFLLGTLAGVLPALQAAKEKPVDALRSD